MRVDRYILFEWVKVFMLTLLVLFSILLLSDLQDNLPDLLSYGAGNLEIITHYVILLPGWMPVAIPVSFMISLLFTLGQLHRNHELTALRNAGLSLFRITRSLWLMGLFLMGFLFQLNANLVPWSVETAREHWNALAFNKAISENVPESEVGLLYNLTFYNRKDGRLWFLNRFNEYNYRGYGITVSEVLVETGAEKRRLMANEGYYDDLLEGWTFLNGREMRFDAETGDPIYSIEFEQMSLKDFGEDPDLMKVLEKRPKDLSLSELRTAVEYLRPAGDPRLASYAVTFYDRLFSPVSCLIILGLAIPFSVTGVRVNPFVGVSKAMGLLFLYYILLNMAQFAGSSGLNPLWAALIPNVAAFSLVGYYYYRLQQP